MSNSCLIRWIIQILRVCGAFCDNYNFIKTLTMMVLTFGELINLGKMGSDTKWAVFKHIYVIHYSLYFWPIYSIVLEHPTIKNQEQQWIWTVLTYWSVWFSFLGIQHDTVGIVFSFTTQWYWWVLKMICTPSRLLVHVHSHLVYKWTMCVCVQ